jgi:hypothetical protein
MLSNAEETVMTARSAAVPPVPVLLDEVTTALQNLSNVVNCENDLSAVVDQVCAQVVRAVPGLDEASVTLLRHGSPYTAASTSDVVVELDGHQYRENAGPCLDAATTGRLVRASIDEAARRWPLFARASRAAGMGSFVSAPITVDGEHSGAINGYSRAGHGFADFDGPLLELYIAAVETALRGHTRYRQMRELANQLRTALESRAVIDQAKGVLMATHGVTAGEAFAMLVSKSQHQNVKLRDVARQLVTGVLGRGAE